MVEELEGCHLRVEDVSVLKSVCPSVFDDHNNKIVWSTFGGTDEDLVDELGLSLAFQAALCIVCVQFNFRIVDREWHSHVIK